MYLFGQKCLPLKFLMGKCLSVYASEGFKTRCGVGGGVDVWLKYYQQYWLLHMKQLCMGMFQNIIRFILSWLTAMLAKINPVNTVRKEESTQVSTDLLC